MNYLRKYASLFLLSSILIWLGCAKEEVIGLQEPATDEFEEEMIGAERGGQPLGSLETLYSLEQLLKGPIPEGYVLQPIIGQMEINGDVFYQGAEPPIFRMWGDNDFLDFGTAAYIESYYMEDGYSFFGGEGIISQLNPDENTPPEEISDRIYFYSDYQYSEEEPEGLIHYSKLFFYEGTGVFQDATGIATRKLHLTDPENYVGTIDILGYVLLPE